MHGRGHQRATKINQTYSGNLWVKRENREGSRFFPMGGNSIADFRFAISDFPFGLELLSRRVVFNPELRPRGDALESMVERQFPNFKRFNLLFFLSSILLFFLTLYTLRLFYFQKSLTFAFQIIQSARFFEKIIMKKDIHPKTHPVVFRDASAGKDFVVMSTITSKETEKINGVDHYVIHVDISSASHPFFTGKQKLVDTSGRVEKFKRQMEKVKK